MLQENDPTNCDKIVLNESIRLVIVQFSFKNEKNVPMGIEKKTHETQERRQKRIQRRSVNNPPKFKPTPKTEIKILRGLEEAGYQLVSAYNEPRIDPKDRNTYHMVRFTFSRNSNAKTSDGFKKIRLTMRQEMERMCHLALWRVRAFINPFFENDSAIEGVNTVSINLEYRNPKFHDDGSPFVEWLRDGEGNRIGLNPNPVKALHILEVQENELCLDIAPE